MTNTIIIIYLLCVLGVGLAAGKGIKNISQYAVAGKSYGSLIIFATLTASFIGGGFSMGNAEKVFLFGIVNIVALWGFSLKELLVARFIAPRMDRYASAISVGDIMHRHYGPTAQIFSSIFGFLLCAGILGAPIGAIGHITNLFMGIDRFWGIMLGCGIIIVYATAGGMKAVVWTDIVQFVILGIGLPLTLILGVIDAGGPARIIDTVPSSFLSLPTDPLAITALVSLFLTFVVGETLVPPYLQRLLIGRSARDVARGTLYSGLFSIPFFAVTGLIGLVAFVLNPELNPNLAMPYLIQQSLPPLLQGVVIAAVLAIVMSSADSFLNAAAICCINDVIKPLRKKKLPPEKEVRAARTITFAVGALAVIFALSIESVLDILVYSYNFWAPIILVPLVMALTGRRVNKTKFVTGALSGIAGMLIWDYLLTEPWEIDGLVIGVLANLTAFVLVRGSDQ